MADVKIIPTVAETREQQPQTPDAGLKRLADTVVKNGRNAVAAALTVLTLSTPALADETPENKGVRQVVTLKDGRQMSFAEIVKLKGAEKDAVIDGMSRSEKIKFKEWDLETANQEEKQVDTALDQENKGLEQDQKALDQTTGKRKEVGQALDQMNSLYTLLDELFAEQGLQTISNEKYKTKAIIVANVLTNPILTAKFTPDTINLLKDMEISLNKGKNPFIYMSKEGRAKLQALLKS